MQKIDHDGRDPRAVLNRRRDTLGEGRTCLRAALDAPAGEGPVLGDAQWLGFGQIEDLPGGVVRCHVLAQHRAATGADLGEVIDSGVWSFDAAQGFVWMDSLPAGILSGWRSIQKTPRRHRRNPAHAPPWPLFAWQG